MFGVNRFVLAAGLLLGLVGLYIGAYYALVERHYAVRFSVPYQFRAAYRLEFPGVEAFFSPCHWFDRQIRPDHWTILKFEP